MANCRLRISERSREPSTQCIVICRTSVWVRALSLSRNASQVATVDSWAACHQVVYCDDNIRHPLTTLLYHCYRPRHTYNSSTAVGVYSWSCDSSTINTIDWRYDHRINLISFKLFCDTTPMSLLTLFWDRYIFMALIFFLVSPCQDLGKNQSLLLILSTRSVLIVNVSTNRL